MSYTYADRKRPVSVPPQKDAAPQPSVDALRSGAASPTQEQMGRRVDLPDAMRSKMETAFGADLSAVKLYESEAVADAGASAVTRGSDIAFAPGMLDFSSFGGQALLGHELSHVVSQQRGEVTGGGFLNDAALEARADREGAMAAAGRQVVMPAALSAVTAAPAAGPMQADKGKHRWNPFRRKGEAAQAAPPAQDAQAAPTMPAFDGVHIDPSQAGKANMDRNLFDFHYGNSMSRSLRPGGAEMKQRFLKRYNGPEYDTGEYTKGFRDVRGERYQGRVMNGFAPSRIAYNLAGDLGEGRSEEELRQIMDNAMAPKLKNVGSAEEGGISEDEAHGKYIEGLKGLKQLNYEHLLRMEASYGRLGSQMHPEDFMRQVGPEFYTQTANMQDAAQLIDDAPEGVFDYENSADDRHFRDLTAYFQKMTSSAMLYASAKGTMSDQELLQGMAPYAISEELEGKIGGPSMDPKQAAAYQKGLKQRAKKGNWQSLLFGRFK